MWKVLRWHKDRGLIKPLLQGDMGAPEATSNFQGRLTASCSLNLILGRFSVLRRGDKHQRSYYIRSQSLKLVPGSVNQGESRS